LRRIASPKGRTIAGESIDDVIEPIFSGPAFERQQDPEEFFTRLVEDWNLERLFQFELQYFLFDKVRDQPTSEPVFAPQSAVVIKAPFDVEIPFGTPFDATEIDDHGTKIPVSYKILEPPPVLVYQFMRFIHHLGAPATKINDDLVNITQKST
jgi:hypothetical protein